MHVSCDIIKGKDRCNRDSATAKRQMQYFIDSGKNINSADHMLEAIRSATPLYVFTANLLDIRGQKYKNQKQIKNIWKIHHVKYIYDDAKNEYHVQQFSKIGQGRKYEVKWHQAAAVYEDKVPLLILETVLVPFTPKARMILIFHALIKLVF